VTAPEAALRMRSEPKINFAQVDTLWIVDIEERGGRAGIPSDLNGEETAVEDP
jgi:hypothetical protein